MQVPCHTTHGKFTSYILAKFTLNLVNGSKLWSNSKLVKHRIRNKVDNSMTETKNRAYDITNC